MSIELSFHIFFNYLKTQRDFSNQLYQKLCSNYTHFFIACNNKVNNGLLLKLAEKLADQILSNKTLDLKQLLAQRAVTVSDISRFILTAYSVSPWARSSKLKQVSLSVLN